MVTETEKIKFLEKLLGKKYEIDPKKENYIFPCPNKNCSSLIKNKLKFIVKLDDSQNHCWVCGLKGKNLLPIIKKFNSSYALEFSKLWNIQLKFEPEKVEEKNLLELPADFQLIAELIENKKLDKKSLNKLNYLNSRKVSLPEMWKFKIGISNEYPWNLGPIFPSFNSNGELNLAVIRTIDPKSKFKYKVFGNHSSKIIYNETNLNVNDPIVIFEGVFDQIRSGIENSTCLLGSFLSENSALFNFLIKNNMNVILCLDSDVEEKTLKIAQKLNYYGLEVKITKLSGDDPGSMEKEKLLEDINNSIDYNWLNKINSKIKNIKSGSII